MSSAKREVWRAKTPERKEAVAKKDKKDDQDKKEDNKDSKVRKSSKDGEMRAKEKRRRRSPHGGPLARGEGSGLARCGRGGASCCCACAG